MVLEHHNAIPSSDMMDHSKVCSYTGYLEGDEMESNVAVTGCFWGKNPDEKMFITILSKHSPLHKSFSLDVDGATQHILVDDHDEYAYESLQDDVERAGDSWHDIGGDADMNDKLEDAAHHVSAAQQNGIPLKLKLKIRVGYDVSAKNAFPSNGYQTIDDWMNDAMTHFSTYYKHHTLEHVIHFEVGQIIFVP